MFAPHSFVFLLGECVRTEAGRAIRAKLLWSASHHIPSLLLKRSAPAPEKKKAVFDR